MKLNIQPNTQGDPYVSFLESFSALLSPLFYSALKITSTSLKYNSLVTQVSKTVLIWLDFFFRHFGPESTSRQKARVILKFILLFSLNRNHMPVLPTVQYLKTAASSQFFICFPGELFWCTVLHHH